MFVSIFCRPLCGKSKAGTLENCQAGRSHQSEGLAAKAKAELFRCFVWYVDDCLVVFD